VWCRQDFDSVVDLLDHVVDFHIDDEEFAA
jgi:hypothetical protein